MNIFTIARNRRAFLVFVLSLLALIAFSGPAAAQEEPPPTAEPVAEPTAEPTAVPRPLDDRFGVVESFEDPAAASRLRVGWTRARFQWADVQPDSPNEWRPPLDDEALAAELDAGREVVGLLIGIPDWARGEGGVPRGLALAHDDPRNTWAVFVDEAVSRYAGRIDRWIIWNEPDIADRFAPGHTWDGDIEQFAQLQRTAYLAAKAANPAAVVHLGAFTYFWDPGYFARFLDVIAADPDAATHHYYFDAATAHLYFQPNAVYNILYAFRQVMDARGLDQPIWLVETNAPPMDDPYWIVDNWTLAVTLHEQAAFIPQSIAAALAAGAERIAVYKLKDTPDDRQANPEPFGLIRWDNSRRPAYDAYRVAIQRMSGVTAAERERWDGVGQVRLVQGEQTTTVLFARLPWAQQARVAATAETAELVNMWGQSETIEAVGGVFTVELPAALCKQTIADYCMIGGTTYYLIQDRGEFLSPGELPSEEEAVTQPAAPSATPPAPTATEPSPTPKLTPSPTATATAEATAEATATTGATATAEPSPEPGEDAAAALPVRPQDTPEAEPIPPTSGEATLPANSSGLLALGLGLVLAIGMAGWWLAVRRRVN